MSQKKKKKPIQASAAPALPKLEPSIFPWDFRMKCIILAVLGILFYGNSLVNEYALDDSIAIERNEFVQKGISGIGKILTSDAYASYYSQMGGKADAQYSGGRYRPLTFVTFAIEHQLFGEESHIRHFVNIALYVLLLICILYFLNFFLLKNSPIGGDLAFLTVVLFAIHPIHTEVVANVKSRDEILSLSLIMLTFIFSLKHIYEKKVKFQLIGITCLFLALLAKEYAITLVALLPLLFYLVGNKKPFEAITAAIPYYAAVVVYLMMRIHAVGVPKTLPANDPLVDPFLYATHAQKLATECYALGWYLMKLFIPYPLACDYSFFQVSYKSFSDILVWVPIFLFAGIAFWAFTLFKKKHIMAFPLLFFLACVALISNFLLDLGAVMGERLVFHASLGFLLILSYYGLTFIKKYPLQTRKSIITTALAVIVIAAGAVVLPRNAQWKNDDSLFIHDVRICTNDALLNNDAGWCYLGLSESPENKPEQARALLDSAKKYLYRAVAIHKKYAAAYLNLSVAYFHLSLPDSASYYLNFVSTIYPGHPSLKRISGLISQLYLGKAMVLGGQQKPLEAIQELRKGLALDNPDSMSAKLWDNLGGAYFTIRQWDSARSAWTKTLQIKPDYVDAQRGLQALPKPGAAQ
jgi:tetratricopeptide (TPR) repeat protein